MARGTFANIFLIIKLLKGEIGPKTIHIPSGEKLYVFDAAMKYKNEGQIPSSWRTQRMEVEAPVIGLLMLQGVKAVIAKSFERIHQSNLVGMSIIPRRFKAGEDADVLGLTSHERFTINLPSSVSDIKPSQDVTVPTDNGKYSMCTVDTEGVKHTFL